MSKKTVLALFFTAVFLQSGTYGLTFMLPKLFAEFGANEKAVGSMLSITAVITMISVYYSGHISDRIGRLTTLGISGFTITFALFLFSITQGVGIVVVMASAMLGFGWGLTYTLAPVVLTRISELENRVQIFSLYAVFMMAGFGLSPVFAAYLETLGLDVRVSFRFVAIFCILSGSIFFALKAPITALAVTQTSDNHSRLSWHAICTIFKSKGRLSIIMVCLGASVFAGMNNFQTVFAQIEGQDYADFFLTYTITVVICRLLLVGFSGGKSPYKIIAILQYIMCASIIVFMYVDGSRSLYILSAVLFGIGYGASYPVLAAMAANDADPELVPQTIQLFSLTYFIGIFGFPFIAGWLIVEHSVPILLVGIAILAAIEASMALSRHRSDQRVAEK